MSDKIKCSAAELLAMLSLACRDEVRPTICCIRVERTATATMLIATDGRRLGVLRIGDGGEPEAFSIPRELVDRFALLKPVGEISVSCLATRISISIEGAEVFGAGGADFPNWRNITKGIEPGKDWKELTFTAEYYDSFSVISKLLGGNGFFTLRQSNLLDPVEVVLSAVPDFYGVLMPARNDGTHDTSWVKSV